MIPKDEHAFIIYKTINSINGKIYIGQHNCQICFNDNDCEFKPGEHYRGSGKLIRRAINKYGIENFSRETLHKTKIEEEASLLEIEEIEIHDSTNPKIGYNISLGGNGGNVMNWQEVKCRTDKTHGITKHYSNNNGELVCSKCFTSSYNTVKECPKHGKIGHLGDRCRVCIMESLTTNEFCKIHNKVMVFVFGECRTCKINSSLIEKECKTHGWTLYYGDSCCTCTSQKSVNTKQCVNKPEHGVTKHQGDVCCRCNAESSISIQPCNTCKIETTHQGNVCITCNSRGQFSEKWCDKCKEYRQHKGDTCCTCTVQKAINKKLCEKHPKEHGITTHQGNVCGKCNSQKSVNIKLCVTKPKEHGETKHQGDRCNKCNAEKSAETLRKLIAERTCCTSKGAKHLQICPTRVQTKKN